MTSAYLEDELQVPTVAEARQRLRSVALPSLIVRHTSISTVGNREFPVAAFSNYLLQLLPSYR